MRRISRFGVLIALALFFAGGTPPTASAQSGGAVLRGDVNQDGAVTALDGLAVLTNVVGKVLPGGYVPLPNGDADGNGKLSAADALVILAYVVGKDVSQFPVGKPLASALKIVGGDGQTGTVGQPPHDFLKVRVVDTEDNPVVGIPVVWAVTEGGGSIRGFGAPSDTLPSVSGENGEVWAVFTLGREAGIQKATAAIEGLTPVTFTLTAISSAPSKVEVTAGDGQTAVAGSAVATPPSVRVTDAQGNPVPNWTVRFRVATGGGSVTDSTPKTDGSGVATVGSWTLGTTAGANTLQARVEGTAAGDTLVATINATGAAGAADAISKHSGDGGTAEVATTRTLEAKVVDANGNPVPGHTVDWAVAAGGGTLSAATSATDASGVASVVWTFGSTAGSQSVTATSSGASGALTGSPLTYTVTTGPAPAAQLAVTQQPSSTAQSGVALPVQPVVQLQDQYGNAVSQSGVDVTATIASGGGTLGGTATVATDAAGTATFTDLVISGTVGDRTLGFGSGSLTGATSGAIALTAGSPASLAIHAGDGQTAVVGNAVATAPAVKVTDGSGNPVSGVSVTFAVASGGGSVTGATPATDASGVATLGSWTLGTTAGANTVTASATGLASVTFSATGTADTPASITRTAGDGQSATVGTAVATAPQVTITDQHGNPVSGVSVTFTVASGGGSVTGASQTTDVNGRATVGNWTLGTTAGANTLSATAGALSTTFSATGTVDAPASITKTAGDGQSATVGTAVATAPQVTITDQHGNPVSGVSVTFAVASGGGSVTGASQTTDVNGRATVGSWTLGTTAGSNTLSATAGALSTTFTATGTVDAPASVSKTAGDGQSATVGTAVATAPQVTITDQYGNPVSGVSVTFAVASGGGSATGTSQTTDVNGRATVGSWTLGTTAGTNTLSATAGALSTTFSATGTVDAPASISKTAGDGQSATVGTAVATAPQVTITDQYGNPVSGVSVTFTVASGGGSVTGASQTTDVNGRATVGSWTLGTTAGTNTLSATAGALSTTFSATGTVDAPASISKTAGDGQSATVGTAVATAPQVTITDQHGNPVSGVSVTFAVASGGGSVTGASQTTDVNGRATVGSWTLGTTAGTNTLSATAGALSTTFSATGTADVAANVAKTAGDGQSATVGTAVATAPQVTITDQYGNPVSGVSVTFAVASGGGSATGTSQTTDVNGRATVGSWTLGTTAGTNTLSATAGALSTTFSATGTVDAPASISKTAGDGQSATVGTAVATAPQVTITDQHGNPVSGVSVTFAVASGGGSVTGASQTTDVNGRATVGSWTLGTTAGTNTLSATAGALSTTFSATGTVDAPASITKTAGDGQSATVGTAVATAPQVTITDQYGNPVSGVSVTFAVASGGGSATGTSQTTDVNGRATVGSWTLGTTAGTNTLTATAGALNTTFSATATTDAAASISKTAGDGQSATVGTAVATAPQVTITDQYGNPVSGVSVTFAVASGGGSVTGASQTTDVNGRATVGSWTLGTTAGTNTLTATAGALNTTFSATATTDAAASISKTAGDGQSATVGTAVATAPQVTVTDQYGNPVSGVSVTFAVASGGGSVTGASQTTDVNGRATVGSWTLGTTAGTNTLSATAGALSATFSATGTHDVLDHFLVEAQGGGNIGVQEVNVGFNIQVTAQDQHNNTVTSYTGTPAVSATGATLSAGSGATAAFTSGVLSSHGVTFGTTGTSVYLTVADGAQSGSSNTFAVDARPTVTSTSPADNATDVALSTNIVVNFSEPVDVSGTPGTSFSLKCPASEVSSRSFTVSGSGTSTITLDPGADLPVATLCEVAVLASQVTDADTNDGTGGAADQMAANYVFSFETASIPPTAVNDGPAANSAPGDPYHAFYSTSASPQTFNLSAPGVLSNDDLQGATLTSFGADSLSGSVTTYAAGTTVTPLPGDGRTTGSLKVNADGSITFTPPDGFTGNYVFRYQIRNGGGFSDGVVTIAVGERPVATSDTYSPTLVGNVPINTATSTQFRVTANDKGDAKVLAITGETNGTATLNADSTFTFRPTPGFEGAASFSYTVKNGFGTSTAATVSMTVANPVWFVNAGAGAGGDGRFDAPFNSLGALAAINDGTGNNPAANDRIFIYSGSYTGPLTMLSGQRLIGQGASAPLSSIASVTWPADAGSEPSVGGAAPVIAGTSGGITLNSVGTNNTVRGVTIQTTGGTGITGSSFGTLFFAPDVALNTSGGGALSLTNGTLAGNFGSVSSSGGTNNVHFSSVAGTTDLGTGSLSGATGASFSVAGGTVSLTYAGNVTQGNVAPLLSVSGGHTGTLTFNTGTLSATAGTGLQFDNADGAYAFNGTTTLGGGDAAIDVLNTSTGTIAFSTASSVTDPTGEVVRITNSSPTFTYPGAFSKTTTGTGIFVQSSGGSITFSGSGVTKSLSTGISPAVSLSSNNGATINFTGGGLAITTTSGNGFSATSAGPEATRGGTINVTGTGNTITSTTGTALNVQNATIGASGLAFQSISANGGANGIILNNTGTSGGLTVTGSGGSCTVATPTCTGGRIQGSVGANGAVAGNGVSLSNTQGTSLSSMRIDGHQNHAIQGSSVTGFTLSNSLVENSGNDTGFDEGNLSFSNLLGSASVSNSTLKGGFKDNVRVVNTSASDLTLTVTGSTIRDNDATGGSDGIFAENQGTGTLSVSVSGSTFAAHKGDHVQIDGESGGNVNVTLASNTFSGGHASPLLQGITLSATGTSFSGTYTYSVTGNTITGNVAGSAIHATRGDNAGIMKGTISGNVVGDAAVANSGSEQASGIFLQSRGTGTHTALVTNNQVYQYMENGIRMLAGTGSSTMNLTVTGNTISNPGAFAAWPVQMHGGTNTGDSNQVCLDLGGGTAALENSFAGVGDAASGYTDFDVRQRFLSTVKLPGYTGANSDNAAVVSYVQGRNAGTPTGNVSNNVTGGGGGFINTNPAGSACPQP